MDEQNEQTTCSSCKYFEYINPNGSICKENYREYTRWHYKSCNMYEEKKKQESNEVNTMDNEIAELKAKLEESGVTVTEQDLKGRFDLMKGFGVPENEINRSILNYYAQQAGVKVSSFYSGKDNPEVKVNTLTKENAWASVRVKVVQLWDSKHDSIGQVGLVGDDTGTIKFTKWASANLPNMEEGKCYKLLNVVTSMFNERMQISMNKRSTLEPIDEDIEVGYPSVTVIGALVHIQDGSGLIKRCPQCNRSLRMGVCQEHGKVDGVFDIRIKGTIDDGTTAQDILLNAELTEKLTGIDLELAKTMATQALDQSVVLDEFKRRTLFKFYIVTGSQLDRFILTDEINELEKIPQDDIDALLNAIPQEAT